MAFYLLHNYMDFITGNYQLLENNLKCSDEKMKQFDQSIYKSIYLNKLYIFLLVFRYKINEAREYIMDGTKRKNIEVGMKVKVVQKQDQRSGKLTEGIVSKILTNSKTHPHGIKVMLEDGVVGRVKE